MGGVALNEAGFGNRGGGFEGVVEVDSTVGGAGENLQFAIQKWSAWARLPGERVEGRSGSPRIDLCLQTTVRNARGQNGQSMSSLDDLEISSHL